MSEERIKILLLGPPKSGKTCIANYPRSPWAVRRVRGDPGHHADAPRCVVSCVVGAESGSAFCH